MVYACGCQSREGLDPPFGLGPTNRCESEEERVRRECLMNPFGPTDEPRKECMDALAADGEIASLDLEFCQSVLCADGTAQFTMTTDRSVGCGCFAPAPVVVRPLGAARGCEVMQCATGTCSCQGENGGIVCGCVGASRELMGLPSGPPLDFGLPTLDIPGPGKDPIIPP